jgi:hypothetical protein
MSTHNSKGITDEQVIEALETYGDNIAATAKRLKCDRANISRRRQKLIKRGLWKSTDKAHVVPDGYSIKGKSQYFDKDGNPAGVWVKSDLDKDRQREMMIEEIEKLTADIPARQRVKVKLSGDDQLANMFTFSDYHLAMYAWHEEGGTDWNRDIAMRTLKAAMTDMLNRAPKAGTCIINQLGDFLHSDGMTPTTPTSGHLLDQDGSPTQMVSLAIEAMDYLLTEALRTHDKVRVVIAQGNHDLYSSIWLRKMFMHLYRDEPRIEFIDNAVPFYAMQWGKSLIGFHHGHKVKFDSLPDLFANEFRHMLGTTDRSYIHMGHYHHKTIKEFGKTVVEMHRTLASRDSHASFGGYHSERATDLITYHKDYGEVGRLTVVPAMLRI